MDFLRNVTRDIGKKSGQLVETTKITAKIVAEENKIKKMFSELGEQVYEDFCNGVVFDEKYMVTFSDIGMLKDTIEELRQEMMDVKGVRVCSKCGAEVALDSRFCTKCGAKQEAEQVVTESVAKVCKNCGATLEGDSQFCPECGSTVED